MDLTSNLFHAMRWASEQLFALRDKNKCVYVRVIEEVEEVQNLYTHILLTPRDSLSSAAAGPELENRPPLPDAMATCGNTAR